jgi:uncharacterized protein YdaU (DUF1376 family)
MRKSDVAPLWCRIFPDKELRENDSMDAENYGAFTLLRWRSWFESPPGSLPDDDELLSRWARCTPERWRQIKASVMAPFRKVRNRYKEPKIHGEFCNARNLLNARVAGGKLGAEKRYRSKDLGSSPISKPVGDPKVTDSLPIARKEGREGIAGSKGSESGGRKEANGALTRVGLSLDAVLPSPPPGEEIRPEEELRKEKHVARALTDFTRGRIRGEPDRAVCRSLLRHAGGSIARIDHWIALKHASGRDGSSIKGWGWFLQAGECELPGLEIPPAVQALVDEEEAKEDAYG